MAARMSIELRPTVDATVAGTISASRGLADRPALPRRPVVGRMYAISYLLSSGTVIHRASSAGKALEAMELLKGGRRHCREDHNDSERKRGVGGRATALSHGRKLVES